MSGEAPSLAVSQARPPALGAPLVPLHWRQPITPRPFKVHRFPSWDDGGGAVQVGPVTVSWTTLPKRGDQ